MAQQRKQLGRQHDKAILMAFGLLNPDDHPLAIQVGQAEGAEFGEPEPGGIERGEDGAMLQVAWGRKDGSDIGGTEESRELTLPPGIGNMFQHPLVSEGGVIEEREFGISEIIDKKAKPSHVGWFSHESTATEEGPYERAAAHRYVLRY
jgi:hypothetical protein